MRIVARANEDRRARARGRRRARTAGGATGLD
eukprot:COSAG01_NODE_31407_length_598_cov_1.022044_2_plen_31_part_01